MKKSPLIIGGAILVLLLAGAAFVGARLLSGQGLPGLSSGGPEVFTNPDGGQSVRINADDIQPAKELPQTSADVRGVFDHRQDNSIFIGSGKVTVSVGVNDETGDVQTTANHDGPTVEVVVAAQTVIYEDVTMKQFNGPPPQAQKIQQVVEPGSLDDIGQASTITVWGKKTGDRLIAEILVFSPPAFITK